MTRADKIDRTDVAAKKRILFAGHDFKFLRPVLDFYKKHPSYEVVMDEYSGHVIKDKSRSNKLLDQADIVFCEWCMGNAEWYSHNVRDGQKLIIRFHRQEIETTFLDRIKWERVHRIVFICQEMMDQMLRRFPSIKNRAVLIYNLVDCERFDIPKLPWAEFNLGLLGSAPELKAPHLAFEMLKILKQLDKRYTLFIKGKHPWEYKWLWQRPESRKYYENFYNGVNTSPYTNSIVFDPHGDDVPEWFTKIGFILSTSDYEGSHQAVAEGMASGTIPVIRNWKGASTLYPEKYVFNTVADAVELITKWNSPANYTTEHEEVREFAKTHFCALHIIKQYEKLFEADAPEPVHDSNPRILVYADVDMNIIDGSTTWLTSLINLLTCSNDAETNIDLLLKRPILEKVFISNLKRRERVNILDPFDTNTFANITNDIKLPQIADKSKSSLSPDAAVSLIAELDTTRRYTSIVIRGEKIALSLLNNKALLHKTIVYSLTNINDEFFNIVRNCKYLACQTPQLRDYFSAKGVPEEKTFILPPMVEDVDEKKVSFRRKGFTLLYSGKLSADYNAVEILTAFKTNLKERKDYRFDLAVGKIYKADGVDFVQEVNGLLNKNDDPRINIYYELNRNEVAELIKACDLGISWRSGKYDDSMEISTKTLEYGSYGKPVLLNSTGINLSVLGEDYPLYADTLDEFIGKIELAFSDNAVYEKASRIIFSATREYMYKLIFPRVQNFFLGVPASRTGNEKRTKVLFACETGKWKFITPIINELMKDPCLEIETQDWKYYDPRTLKINMEDVIIMKKQLEWADVIFCEWLNFNAIWYSKNKRPDQKLIIRMHRYEIYTLIPGLVNWKNVDQIIFITDYLRNNFERLFQDVFTNELYKLNRIEVIKCLDTIGSLAPEKKVVIYNGVDCDKFFQEKEDGCQFNIGLLGWAPKLKRVDRALDILGGLKIKNDRYRLFLKGTPAKELKNLNDKEKTYFEEQLRRIENSPYKESIIIEGYGDPCSWFRKIGFILSTSDIEGSHQAVVEGMASGSIPVVINWEGADSHFPREFVCNDVTEMINLIDSYQHMFQNDINKMKPVSNLLYRKCKQLYDTQKITRQFKKLFE